MTNTWDEYIAELCRDDEMIHAIIRIAQLEAFAVWVAEHVLSENFNDNADSFAELACRRLCRLGIVRKNGEYYTMDEVE